jgi:ATP-binding cassette subfamily B protein
VTHLEAWGFSEGMLGEALFGLARASGIEPAERIVSGPPAAVRADAQALERWLVDTGDFLGIDVQAVGCGYAELGNVLERCAPALLRLRAGASPLYLAVLGANRRHLRLLTPELSRVRVPLADVRAHLVEALEAGPAARLDEWLAATGVAPRRRARARGALLEVLLGDRQIGGLWLLRPDPGHRFDALLTRSGAGTYAGIAALLSLAQVGATLGGWALLGRGALAGSIEPAWIVAWVFTIASALPLQIGSRWLGGKAIERSALLLGQRLLCGALRLHPDQIRARGSGRLLAMVCECEALETAGLNGAFAALLSLIQLASASVILALGAGGFLHLSLLVVWTGVSAVLLRSAWQARGHWIDERLDLSCSLLENVLGHRTRVVQQPPTSWHVLEDHQTARHLQTSRALDRAQTQLAVLPARGWLVVGFAGLIPAVLARATPVELGVAIGGLLQASMAFAGLAASATSLGSAALAWKSVRELFHAAARTPLRGRPVLGTNPLATTSPATTSPAIGHDRPAGNEPVVDVRGLTYRYRPGSEPVLRDCGFSLRAGEHLLLEGASGGGKSTLTALLLGLRSAEAGHILLGGLDRPTLGASAWLRRIASAPQFHENHILSASLAFNLLMGRSWPPAEDDLREAASTCRELGLGPLLDRMPSGLHQIVGETGWQLSHGERSRIFLARALLQPSDLLVLDETFGALDPGTLRQCMRAVLARPKALIVIAHP